jgi:hypothetical protein
MARAAAALLTRRVPSRLVGPLVTAVGGVANRDPSAFARRLRESGMRGGRAGHGSSCSVNRETDEWASHMTSI